MTQHIKYSRMTIVEHQYDTQCGGGYTAHMFKWEGCIGESASVVSEYIRKHHPEFAVVLVKDGMPVTSDLQFTRVRIYYDGKTGRVVETPRTA